MMIVGTLLHSLSGKQIFRMLITLAYEYLVFMLSLSHENEWYQVRLILFQVAAALLTLFLGLPCTRGWVRICFWNCLYSLWVS